MRRLVDFRIAGSPPFFLPFPPFLPSPSLFKSFSGGDEREGANSHAVEAYESRESIEIGALLPLLLLFPFLSSGVDLASSTPASSDGDEELEEIGTMIPLLFSSLFLSFQPA